VLCTAQHKLTQQPTKSLNKNLAVIG